LSRNREILDEAGHQENHKPAFRNPAFMFSLACLVILCSLLASALVKHGNPLQAFFEESYQLSAIGFGTFTLLLLGLVSGFIGVLATKGKHVPVLVVFVLNLGLFLFFLWQAIAGA
jgi:hypothetical protein